MRIVRVIARLNVGGPARYVIWLSRAFSVPEHRSALVVGRVPTGEMDMEYFAAEHGVEPIRIDAMSREISWRDAFVVWPLFKIFWREHPDLIETHTAKAGAVGRLTAFLYRLAATVARRERPAIVHTFHGHVFHSYYGGLKTLIFLTVERVLARLATDRIVVLSTQQFAEIHGRFQVGRASQFCVVPPGIDFAPFRAGLTRRDRTRASLGVGDAAVAIGIVGRLAGVKNHSLFLESIAELQPKVTDELHVFVIGDGDLRQALEAEARSLGVRNVNFLGDRADVPELCSAMDIIALTSRNEGVPFALIEAMAAERPVVATAVGGIVDLMGPVMPRDVALPEAVQLHEAGLTVRSQNAADVAAALQYLVKRGPTRATMGKRGWQIVEQRHSLDRLVADVSRLYCDAVRAARAG